MNRLSAERRALLEKKLQKGAPRESSAEPIAIIGMACRFPRADSPEAFWQLVLGAQSAIGRIPPDRWDADALFSEDARPGTVSIRDGGFLDRVDTFDAAFFEIAPREAESLDPQQRLLLEVSWEAMEDAGVTLEEISGSDTGVFIGAHSQSSDYAWLAFDDASQIGPFTATGTAHNFLAGRLSYFLDLRGPSLVVDTACSSSLLAVHLACQSLRADECRMALAAGVNLILTPHFSVAATQMYMLAPDGCCKPFDTRADGFGRGEGCGVVLLKRLSQARADGDHVLALIRGSAVNQDGRTNGITAPSGLAQRRVIERALSNAGIAPHSVSYVEAHGTGTPLGDPIEAEALVDVLGRGRGAGSRCSIGAAKANIGHLEGAAGIAGLIKTVMGLKHRIVPPLAQFANLNPHVVTEPVLSVPTCAEPWAEQGGSRIAGVSSFGWSGTNVHMIVEQAPAAPAEASESEQTERPRLLMVSARDKQALRDLAGRYESALGSEGSLHDVAWSSAARRSHLEQRLAVVGTREAVREGLSRFVAGEATPFARVGMKRQETGGLVFVFPGQGSQWIGMGRELYALDRVFREALDACDRAFRPYVTWSLVETIRSAAPDSLETIDVIQPALFAMSVALAARWRRWGVEPDAVIGHSMGEVAAACVAGALTLDDAARVICLRSSLMKQLAGRGRMALIDLPVDDVRSWLTTFNGDVVVAACNSPRTTVVAGESEAVERLVKKLDAADIFCRTIRVDVASHCSQVDPLLATLLDTLRPIRPASAAIPIYSTVAARRISGEEMGAEYWVQNLRQPVQFAQTLSRLIEDGHCRFVELSPHPVLRPAIEDTCGGHNVNSLVVGSLEREAPEEATLLTQLGALYADGLDLDWASVMSGGRFVPLPSYPWQRKRFWVGAKSSQDRWSQVPPQVEPIDAPAAGRDDVFEISWREAPPAHAINDAARWLVLTDDATVGETLAAAAQRRGIVVECAPFQGKGPDELFRQALNNTPDSVVVIAPDWRMPLDATWIGVEHSLVPPLQKLLDLVKTLASCAKPPRLWVITRNAQATDPGANTIEPVGTALWGLLRVAWEEYPEIAGGSVDVVDLDADAAKSVVEHLLAKTPPRQSAIRGGRLLVPRLIPSSAPSNGGLTLRPDAAYLITGGLGGVGLVLARRLVERGARHLVLAGRHGLPPRESWSRIEPESELGRRVQGVEALERAGADVRVVALDVSDNDSLMRTLARLEAEGPAIRGIVHAAAIVHDRLIDQTDVDELTDVIRAKAGGAWHLQRYFLDRHLDFFVGCSSIATLFGQAGQASYAAANAFLDALLQRLSGLGRTATTVEWGGWRDVGLASLSGGRNALENLERDGIGSFETSRGLDALEYVLGARLTRAAVMSVDIAKLTQSLRFAAEPEFFAALATSDSAAGGTRDGGNPRRRLEATEPSRRRSALEQELQGQLAEILRLPIDHIDPRAPVGTLGLESLMALEFHRRVEHALGLKLAKTLVWRYATIEALSEHLLERLFPQPAGPSEAETKPAAALAGDAISEDQALAALLGAKEGR
jgi:epothilone polyketide synthase E